MFTRGGYDWAQHFSSLAAALTALPVNGIVLDAEAIPQNEKGIAGFGLLQDDLGRCGGRTVWSQIIASEVAKFWRFDG